MAKIDDSLISKLEMLARINIDESEREQIHQDLEKMAVMFDKLSEIDTTGVEPLRHVSPNVNVRRKDMIHDQLTNDQAMANAPSNVDGFFAVPKFIK